MKILLLALLACICLSSRISHRLDSSSTESTLARIEALLEAQSLAQLQETEELLDTANEELLDADDDEFILSKTGLDSTYYFYDVTYAKPGCKCR